MYVRTSHIPKYNRCVMIPALQWPCRHDHCPRSCTCEPRKHHSLFMVAKHTPHHQVVRHRLLALVRQHDVRSITFTGYDDQTLPRTMDQYSSSQSPNAGSAMFLSSSQSQPGCCVGHGGGPGHFREAQAGPRLPRRQVGQHLLRRVHVRHKTDSLGPR